VDLIEQRGAVRAVHRQGTGIADPAAGEAAEELEQAQRELSSWDLRLKVAEQQAQFDKSAWMAGDPDAPDVVKAAWAQEDDQ
jgi:hypothetical protein